PASATSWIRRITTWCSTRGRTPSTSSGWPSGPRCNKEGGRAMPGTPNFVSGKLGTISINANFFNAEQYDFEESTTLDDITYCKTTGATFKILLPQYNWANGTVTFVYDTNNQPTISPFDMRPGTLMAMVLYPEGTKPYSFAAYSGNF